MREGDSQEMIVRITYMYTANEDRCFYGLTTMIDVDHKVDVYMRSG